MWGEERLLGNNFRIVQELRAADCQESVAPSRRGRSPEKKGCLVGKWKLEDERRKIGELHQQKGDSNDQECGRQEARNMERRSTDLEKRRRGFQDVGPL